MSNELQPKSKGGRPAFQITDKMRNNVKLLAGAGLGQDKIAIVVGCGQKTLQRKFKKEISQGASYLEAAAVTTVVSNMGKGGSVGQRAAEFLLHCRFGWSRYAPPPAPGDKPEEQGKKAQREAAAALGNEPQEWATLLN